MMQWIPVHTDLHNATNPVHRANSLLPSGLRVHDTLLGGRQEEKEEEKSLKIELQPEMFGVCGFAALGAM